MMRKDSVETMRKLVTLTHQAIMTPRAAAFASIIFSLLFTISIVPIRQALPEDLRGTNSSTWFRGYTTAITLALMLVPFAGIAFLWSVWVVRSRLGDLEDQFFSTVFFVISVFMLFISLRGGRPVAEGVIGSQETSQL